MADTARLTTAWLVAALAALTVPRPVATAADPLDPYARAVVDSVAHPPPATAADLLAAAIKTAGVEATEATIAYTKRLADLLADAGDGRADLLATLGEQADPGGLLRLEAVLASHAADLVPVVAAIDDAGRQRRRDPARIARAVADLRSDSLARRTAATAALGRSGRAALPALADLLATDDAAGQRARTIARGLVRDLGDDARRILLEQLGSAEVRSWPAVIAALEATGAVDVEEFLLAPATVPGTPPEICERAVAALRAIHVRRGDPSPWQPPSAGEAEARVAHALDHALSAAAVSADCRDDVAFARRLGAALHLARDLSALGTTEPRAVRLVLLARLAALAEQPGLGAAPDPESTILAAALAGPDGADLEAVADVLDLAMARGLLRAATLAARGIEEAALPPGEPLDPPPEPLPPAVRRALVRAVAVPDARLQFTAARTLALTAGPPPWPGSSRVVETLAHAATAAGIDRAVVAHPDADVAHELATGLSRFGYAPLVVSTGRAAIVAARTHADTVLVVVGARIILPSAFETAQFIREQPFGDIPPVLVAVDPLDDAPRGRFLTRSIQTFAELDGVALVDRLDSLWVPVGDDTTGEELAPPRFPAVLAELAGADAVAAEARAARAALRRDRARQAATLLHVLHRRGWEIPATACAGLDLASAPRGPAGYDRAAITPSFPPPADASRPEPTR